MKGFVHELGMVDADDTLHIPMRDWQTNHLRGTQRISWDGESWQKKMTYGMKSKGAIFRLGSPQARETWLCEGIQPAGVKAALAQMRINAAVLVTFSAGNLVHISGAVGGRKFVAADNDPPNEQFPARGETGQKAAKATKLPWCMPERSGDDFNDLHQREGILPLRPDHGLRRTRAAA